MAYNEAYEARQRKEKAADECIAVVVDGLKAFFDGKATLLLTYGSQFGAIGGGAGSSTIRFVKDPTP